MTDTPNQPAPSAESEAPTRPARKSRRGRSKLMQFELLSALFSAQHAAPAEPPAAKPKAEDVDTTVAYALHNMRR